MNRTFTATSSRFVSAARILACTAAIALTIGTSAPLFAAIAGYWSFNEGSGTVVNDPINGNTGTLGGTNPGLPSWVAGRSGNANDFALDFAGGIDGSNVDILLSNGGPNVTVPNSPSLQITGDQTISFWLKPDAPVGAGRQNPVAKAYGGEGTITLETNGTFNYYYGTAGVNGGTYQGVTSSFVVADSSWQLITLVRDFDPVNQDVVTWFINGTQFNTTNALYDPAVAGTQPLYFGAGYENSLDGQLDDITLFDEALSLNEIKSVYSLGANPSNPLSETYDVPDLYELWSIFDGGSGSEGIVNGDNWVFTDELDPTGQALGDAWQANGITYIWLGGSNSGLFILVPAPEPSSFMLLGLGMVVLAKRRRRK